MANVNKVILIGNLTRDWELRNTPSGKTVAKSGIAVNRKRGDNQETMFVDLVAWEKSAQTLNQYTSKGDPIYIEGRLALSQWEDKDGNKRSRHEIIVETFQFLGGRSDGGGSAQEERSSKKQPPMSSSNRGGSVFDRRGDVTDVGDDDIPL